jgi:hypothetical protein
MFRVWAASVKLAGVRSAEFPNESFLELAPHWVNLQPFSQLKPRVSLALFQPDELRHIGG